MSLRKKKTNTDEQLSEVSVAVDLSRILKNITITSAVVVTLGIICDVYRKISRWEKEDYSEYDNF